MIELKLNEDQDAYDIVGKYIEKYWQEHYYTDVLVRIATSYDGKTYAPSNEFVAFDGKDGMEYQNDWWEGERYLKIYGIIDIREVIIPENIFDDEMEQDYAT